MVASPIKDECLFSAVTHLQFGTLMNVKIHQ